MEAAKKWLHDVVDNLPSDIDLEQAVERINFVARHERSLKDYEENGGGISTNEMREILKANRKQ
jgi:hypothetical protein